MSTPVRVPSAVTESVENNTSLKARVAGIVNSSVLSNRPDFVPLDPNSKSWQIIGMMSADGVSVTKDSQVQVKYVQIYSNSAGSHAAHLEVRGTIVDVSAPELGGGHVVCPGVGYTPVVNVTAAQCGTFKNTPSAEKIVLADEFGRKVELSAPSSTLESKQVGTPFGTPFGSKRFSYSKGIEGPMISVWKADGKVWFSTHLKIDWSSSYWPRGSGVAKKYPELWSELNGPSADELFGSEVNSPFIYNFVMCHPDVMLVSQTPVEQRGVHLVHIDVLYDDNDLAIAGMKPKYSGQAPTELKSWSEVGSHLEFGAHAADAKEFERRRVPLELRPGEFVIVNEYAALTLQSGDEVEFRACSYRLESPGYSFRLSLLRRQDGSIESNLKAAFFRLLDKAHPQRLGSYDLPIVYSRTLELFSQHFSEHPGKWHIPVHFSKPKNLKWTTQDYKYNTWILFVLAASAAHKQEAYDLLKDHDATRAKIGAEIFNRWSRRVTQSRGPKVVFSASEPRVESLEPETEPECPRADQIISHALTKCDTPISSEIAREQLRANIDAVLTTEFGQSLYKLHSQLFPKRRPAPETSN